MSDGMHTQRLTLPRWRSGLVAATALVALALAACGGTDSSAGVPTLQHGANASSTRHNSAALHAAAQCIRDHGIQNYQDPVVGPGEVVYTDQRNLEKAGDAVVQAALAACRSVIAQANFDPTERPHPPAQMVRDGVREAQCLRAHGLPNWPDPKPTDTFDPGHGFQVTDAAFAGAVPAGANPKQSSAFQGAIQACMAESDAVSRDSELSSLAHGQ
jgi:hypothetical protein